MIQMIKIKYGVVGCIEKATVKEFISEKQAVVRAKSFNDLEEVTTIYDIEDYAEQIFGDGYFAEVTSY